MYNPPLETATDVLAFRQIIHANQFPADPARCNRSLILYDDAVTAGLGYTARLLGRALLVAVREQRVLINAPHPTARWCGRWPYTLACHYEAWTHCPLPANLSGIGKWTHRSAYHDGRVEPAAGSGKGKGHAKKEAMRTPAADMVRISTSQIFKESFFYKFHQPRASPRVEPPAPPSGAAHTEAEAPAAPASRSRGRGVAVRAALPAAVMGARGGAMRDAEQGAARRQLGWFQMPSALPDDRAPPASLDHLTVRTPERSRSILEACPGPSSLSEAAPLPLRTLPFRPAGNFIVLHVRVSEEKSRERGKQMPPLGAYPRAAAAALLKANVSRVFLQTATQLVRNAVHPV